MHGVKLVSTQYSYFVVYLSLRN